MRILALFGGQGSSTPQIFDLLQGDKGGVEFLSNVSKLVNLDASKIGDPHFSQIFIGIYHLGLFHSLQEILSPHEIEMAGYSLGEVSAFLASINAPLKQSIETLQHRTELMTSIFKGKESPFDLLSVSGKFTFEELDTACRKNQCEIAIINGKDHFIIAGEVANLQKILSSQGSLHIDHSKFLSIQEPSHSSFYKDLSKPFTEFLKSQFEKSSLSFPIISPIRLKKVLDLHEEIELLGEELSSQLHWGDVCKLIPEYGYDLILDLGPSSAMSSILQSSSASLSRQKIIAIADFKTMDGIKSYILKNLS